MGVLQLNGVDFRTNSEVSSEGSNRTQNTLFNNATNTSGPLSITGITGTSYRVISAADSASFFYSSGDFFSGKLQKNGVAQSAARRGERPFWKSLLSSSLAGTYYLNFFTDGEIYWSTSSGARSGTRLSNTEQKYKTLFVNLVGAGGGGGAGGGVGNGYVGSGGGSGGLICVALRYDRLHNATVIVSIGEGGAGSTSSGSRGASGGSTGISHGQFYAATASGGGGGIRGTSGGGTAGSSSGIIDIPSQTGIPATGICSVYPYLITTASGVVGGGPGTTSKPSTIKNATKLMPEGGTITVGGAYSNPARGGSSGTATGCGGCGYKGAGGRSEGDGAKGTNGGITAGGSGGGAGLFQNNAGGNGGNGYIEIFY